MSFATDLELSESPGSMTPRGVFVPPWYKPHPDLSVEVRDTKGNGLGFTVGDVAVERRWAIGTDGQVVAGSLFIDKLTEWFAGTLCRSQSFRRQPVHRQVDRVVHRSVGLAQPAPAQPAGRYFRLSYPRTFRVQRPRSGQPPQGDFA